MIQRYSSRLNNLDGQFLIKKLDHAVQYDRIAGYFCSSIFEIADEAIEAIAGKVRIVCNSGLSAADVRTANLAKNKIQQEWCASLPEENVKTEHKALRLTKLYALLVSGKVEIKVVPDEIYGLVHGKAGVITYKDGTKTSFLGSVNETKAAYTNNYELLWEDSSEEAVDWVQKEFDFFWNNPAAVRLCDFVIQDIKRIANRKIIPLKTWQADSKEPVPAAVVEDPIFRKEFGLWEHQKYFIERAFREHQQTGGARLILADMVGLGKTVQLAMAAKLMALQGKLPILVVVPKTLTFQWQDELMSLLEMPSAVWMGRGWIDETGHEYPAFGEQAIRNCPRRIGIVSQGIITRKTAAAEQLKNDMAFECVIVDEAHRARRRNTNKDPRTNKAIPNNLLVFIQDISSCTQSLLLATATPIQVHPIEAFDLLEALNRGENKSADRVLGNEWSLWRSDPMAGLDYISEKETPPETQAEIWNIIRNPFPPREESQKIRVIRNNLEISDRTYILPRNLFQNARKPEQNRIMSLYTDDDFIKNHNPYVRCIIRRTRESLEKDGLLKKINVRLYGESSDEALELKGYFKQAYDLASNFCQMLSSSRKGGGFMTTLVLKRIGSTMCAGEKTAIKILGWTEEGRKTLEELYDSDPEEETDDEMAEENADNPFKNLSEEEIDCLTALVEVLKHNKDTDPKYLAVKEILTKGTGTDGPWKDRGCIVFSQYYDSAWYVAERLAADLKDEVIGLYVGGDRSGIFEDGHFSKRAKDEIKRMVRDKIIKVLVGTDAASEGLNLQTLSTLINLDLPWNPTRLEQRKGRIQRIGQVADTVLLYNLRYKDSVEDRVHERLSGRLKDIFDIFGQVPDILEDIWVDIAKGEEEKAEAAIRELPQTNPYKNKYDAHAKNGDKSQWEQCEIVLDKKEVWDVLSKGWS